MSEEKRGPGNPATFQTPEELEQAFEYYCTDCNTKEKPLTMSGFCKYIKSYKDLLNSYGRRDEYSSTINKIRCIVENDIEENALTNKYNANFSAFNLRNNFGWKDRTETENVNHNVETTFEQYKTKLEEERNKAKQEKVQEEEEV